MLKYIHADKSDVVYTITVNGQRIIPVKSMKTHNRKSIWAEKWHAINAIRNSYMPDASGTKVTLTYDDFELLGISYEDAQMLKQQSIIEETTVDLIMVEKSFNVFRILDYIKFSDYLLDKNIYVIVQHNL